MKKGESKAPNFDKFTTGDWLKYDQALNQEKSVEEYGVDLTAEEKERYNKDLEWLKNERAKHPNVPISYEIKYSYFD